MGDFVQVHVVWAADNFRQAFDADPAILHQLLKGRQALEIRREIKILLVADFLVFIGFAFVRVSA